MKNWTKRSAVAVLCGLCIAPAWAELNTLPNATLPSADLETTTANSGEPITAAQTFGIATPNLDAKSYYLVDYHSGQVLAAYNATHRQAPASLTKMMTSYVIGDALKQGKIRNTDLVPISTDAWAQNPKLKGSSLMFLRAGQKVPVSELNKGIIIDSGNDACIAMAQYVSGSQNTFVQSMNRYAKQMNLRNTHFMTVHGLDHEGQYSTAQDMATIAKHLIKDLPQEYKIYAQKEFKFNGIKQRNRNGLLWDTTLRVDGLKTGHTKTAGYNLVASALGDNNMRLISVVMGTPSTHSRELDSKKLLRWGFANFETLRAIAPGKPLLQPKIYYGMQDTVPLGVLKSAYLTLPKGQRQNVKIRYELNQNPLQAPLAKGQVVGKVVYELNGKAFASVNLQVLQNMPEGGMFSRAWDWLVLKVKNLF